jgi:hypothetical protein
MVLPIVLSRPKIICELHNINEEEHVMRISRAHRYQVSSIECGREFPRRVMILPE